MGRKVSVAHFFDFEFGHAVVTVAPSYRDNGKTVAADDGFKRKFDSDVEVGRKDGADAVNNFFAVGPMRTWILYAVQNPVAIDG